MTAWGTARLAVDDEIPLLVESPPADGVPLVLDFLPFTSTAVVPFVVAAPKAGFKAASWRTSSITRRSKAGNVDTSPERRSERA